LCELNKFDDMMDLLARKMPGFVQVVAVDRQFDLFTRAWCVAELAQANASKIKQAMKFYSRADIKRNEQKLRDMDVRKMQASRPEDVEMILKKIEDPVTFNADVLRMIFDEKEGLLTKWEAESHMGKLATVGRLVVVRRNRLEERSTSDSSPAAVRHLDAVPPHEAVRL